MSILGMQGFEYRFEPDDGLAGSNPFAIVYSTTVPSSLGSASSYSASVYNGVGSNYNYYITSPWKSGELNSSTANTPSTTVYWFHYHARRDAISSNGEFGVGRSNTAGVTLQFKTGGEITIRCNRTNRASTSGEGFNANVWYKFHVKVDHQVGGNVEVYRDGVLSSPILTYTLTATDITNMGGLPNEFWWSSGPSADLYTILVDDLFALDPADGVGVTNISYLSNASIQSISLTSDGTYTDWAGSYTDIDEIPRSNVDTIDSTSIDQVSTFGTENASQAMVFFAQTKIRGIRTGTDAGTQLQVRIRSGSSDKDEAITEAAVSCNIIQHHHTSPDGSPWNKARFDDTEFGVVSKT